MAVNAFESLKNKVAIITGASSGIGAETAVYFAKLGCRLVITGRNAENLEDTKQKCQAAAQTPDDVVTIIGDVCKSADCQAIVQKAVDSFKGIDVLINSAGILVPGTLENATEEDYDRQMDGNVRSVFLLTKCALPHLIATKGTIVNVSSVCGTRVFPGICVYNMSKAALDSFTQTLALEMAPHGVRVNSVNPGVIVTDIHRRGGMNDEQYKQYLEHSKTTHALGRVGTCEEVATSIAFLASSASSFTTGALLPIDGGRGIMCPR